MVQGAQTADRAIQLLLLVVDSPEPLGLTELGRRAGLNKAAIYRLLGPLVKHGLLAREDGGRRYTIGSGLVALSAMVAQRVNARKSARPVMERVCARTEETVSFHIAHLRYRVCIDVVESPRPIRRVVPLGERLPLFAGPTGKAILAHCPPDEIAEIVAWAREEGVDSADVERQLEAVRRDGFLASVGDRTAGVGGLSVPIFDGAGVAGAITVSGPDDRFTEDVMASLAEFVLGECTALSASLGRVDPLAVAGTLDQKEMAGGQ